MVYTKQGPPPHHDSDESLQWEDFFGTSVDISSSLLDMYDSLVTKNKTTTSDDTQGDGSITINVGDPCEAVVSDGIRPSDGSREDAEKKRRPLSVSSLSSSSSSSSSSLPRNALDVKKSYLASIESLDDEMSEDGNLPICSGLESMWPPNFRDRNPSHIERVLLEIVETERTYVRDLKEIIQGYLHHVHVGLSEDSLKELFGNIEDICQFNSFFLADLEQNALDAVAMARCFVRHGNGFAVYTQYCTNYPTTVAALTNLMRNRETAEIFKARQKALHHSLPLGSYLLKPVQRILKYHLLLQNIVLHMDKDGVGYPDVKNALSVMTGIAYHINEMKRKHEHAVRVQEIQSLLYGWQGRDLTTYGELVAEGSFRMLGAKALRHIFLFDKILLVAKKKEEGILIYKAHIECSDLMLIESIRGEPLCFHVIPFLNPRMQFTFQARNVDQKREWCLQLKQVILENYNAVIPSHARQLVLELGQSRNEDCGPIEKSSTRRLLSAPEYLERRRHERRKSNNSSRNSLGKSAENKELAVEERTKTRRGRMVRRTWNGLAEETTDTENEEASRPRGFAPSQRVWHGGDPAGEYVMFYFPRGRSYVDDPPTSVSVVSNSSSAVQIRTELPQEEKSPSATTSWRQNGAVRRVQSFTGLARAKVASLHHTFSFCQTPLGGRPPNPHSTVAASKTETTPAWLESDDSASGKKSDSLPRSFRPGINESSDRNDKCREGSSVENETEHLENKEKTVKIEDSELRGIKANGVFHPEHKIYFRSSSGRAVVKNLISTVGSRFAFLRGTNVTDSVVLVGNEQNVRRASSRSSLWSERDLGRKNIGNKLMQSIAWVYGAKGRPKKDKILENVQDTSRYRTNSVSLGARMAQPLESEYCVPSSLTSLSHLDNPGHDKRPHSLLSQSSSNTTASSADRSDNLRPLVLIDDSDQNEDSLSDASETSADSYYERTFEEIENVLTEDLFRDSAIYSDPEDADLSAAESSPFLKSDRFEVEDCPKEERVGVECCTLSVQERRLELERWCVKEGEMTVPNEEGKNGLPLMKGWVKHVVNKLQGDSP